MEKREIAYKMYEWGSSQNDIAKLLGTAVSTISNWKKEDDWEERLETQRSHAKTIQEGVKEIVAYQVEVLQSKVKEYKQGNKVGTALPSLDKGDLDALLKGVRALDTNKSKLEDIIKASTELLVFVRGRNIELAKELGGLSALFIESISKKYD